MKILYKILHQNADTREGVVVTISALGILVNLLLAVMKIIIGLAVSSVAIVSEGFNNASDVASSVLTIVGTKLSGKKPTNKHPFGYGRIEYLTSLVIAVIILVAGIEMLINAVKQIFAPETMSVSYVILVIVAISAVVKFVLGTYMLHEGKRIDSGTLIAVGTDCRNDSFVSLVTIVSMLVFLLLHLSIDAYAGIFISIFIVKAGLDILKDTLGDILGRAGDHALAVDLYKEIRSEAIVLNAADMMLHNYGPDAYSGSVNIEVDHRKTVGEVYAAIHALQLHILEKHHITMVFGIYAVDADHEHMKKMRKEISAFVRDYAHVKNYHALYLDTANNVIYCDLVVDYELEDWDRLREDFLKYMASYYPEQQIELVIETDFV